MANRNSAQQPKTIAIVDYYPLIIANYLISPDADIEPYFREALNNALHGRSTANLLETLVLFDEVIVSCSRQEFEALRELSFSAKLIEEGVLRHYEIVPGSSDFLLLVERHVELFKKYFTISFPMERATMLLSRSLGGNSINEASAISLIQVMIRSGGSSDEELKQPFKYFPQ